MASIFDSLAAPPATDQPATVETTQPSIFAPLINPPAVQAAPEAAAPPAEIATHDFRNPYMPPRKVDPNMLGLSDVGPMLHQAATGVTPVADMYSAAMDAGPSNWLGLTHIPGDTFSERFHNQLAASQKDLADFHAKHPLASTIAQGAGMVAGDIPRTALLGPFAPLEVGAEAGLSVAPHRSVKEDLGYTALGAPIGWALGQATSKVLKPLSALGERLMTKLESPAERYVKYVPPPEGAAATPPPGLVWPLVKTGLKLTPGVAGYLHGGLGEGAIGHMFSHSFDSGLKYLDDVFAKRAAARVAEAATPPRLPTKEEWAQYWAGHPRGMAGEKPLPAGAKHILPTMAAQYATPDTTSLLARILAQHIPGGDQP